MESKDQKNSSQPWVWVTFLGSSLSAVTNTLWAAIEYEKLPLTDLYFFINKSPTILANFTQLQRFIPILTSAYHLPEPRVHSIEIEETQFGDIKNKIQTFLKK